MKKVLALHYPEPTGNPRLLRGVCKMIHPTVDEMNNFGIIIGKPEIKEFLNGKIKMFYTNVSDVPNVKVNGIIYNGPIVFVAYDEEGQPTNINNKQVGAIKLVVKQL